MSPLTTWLSDAPRLVAVPMAPLVRLNRPVPRVRSATTRTEATPKDAGANALEDLNGDQRDGMPGQRVQHAANRQQLNPIMRTHFRPRHGRSPAIGLVRPGAASRHSRI